MSAKFRGLTSHFRVGSDLVTLPFQGKPVEKKSHRPNLCFEGFGSCVSGEKGEVSLFGAHVSFHKVC